MNTDERLRELMDERRLTMYSLAKRSNLSWNTVKNIFAKKTQPTVTTLEMLCNGLDISLAQFFDVDGETSPLTDEQHNLLQRWSMLNEQEKALLNDFIEYMLEKHG